MILDYIGRYLERNADTHCQISQIVVNPNFSGVQLDNRDVGVAMNIRSGDRHNTARISGSLEKLIGMTASAGIEQLGRASDPLSVSLQVALINALSRPLMTKKNLEQKGFRVSVGRDTYSIKDMVENETVVVVGFGGNVTGIAARAANTYVTELEPERFYSTVIGSSGVSHGPGCAQIIPADQADPCFEKADTIILTGCTLVTHTMEGILEKYRQKRIIIYGMTASFYPEILFEKGVDAVACTVVTDGDTMMQALADCGPMVERFFSRAGQELFIQRVQ